MSDQSVYQPRRVPRESRRMLRGIEHRLIQWGDRQEPAAVYLHGWGDTAATFQFVVDAFARERSIVAADWRGFGESGKTGPAYWFPDYVADLDALLEMLSPDSPVVLIGHSMGANVAALYAGARPERVAAFVNIEGFGLAESDPGEAPAHYRRWLSRLRNPAPFSTYTDFDQLVARIVKRSPRMREAHSQFVARAWAARCEDGVIRLKADPGHRLPNGVMYRRLEAEACWRAITAPVLLVTGADTEFRESLDAWLADDPGDRPFPGAALEVIPDAGHMLHFEAPGRLAACIETFLDAL